MNDVTPTWNPAAAAPPSTGSSSSAGGSDQAHGSPPHTTPPPPPSRSGAGALTSTALALGRSVVSRAAASSALESLKHTATGVVRAMRTALGTAGASHLDDYGKDPALERELAPLASFFYDRYWRVQVEGASLLPHGPSIIVANHSGAMPYDGPVLHAAIGRERPELPEARWLIEDQLFYAPFLGTLLNRIGAVRANPENALRLLGEGRPVIVFPEGLQGISKPFSERYRLMRFGRGGFVKLALRARVPIVPVAIVGAEETSPLIARLPAKFLGLPWFPVTSPIPLPARWRIRIGEPLQVDELSPDGHEDLLLVNRLNERTRETIQGMLESMLKARDGVFV
ncbi:MAG: acyltransferase family protein [Myxococcaceae bacterium]|nr:acyltransferase family protein [Myxococcaceae bacterium]